MLKLPRSLDEIDPIPDNLSPEWDDWDLGLPTRAARRHHDEWAVQVEKTLGDDWEKIPGKPYWFRNSNGQLRYAPPLPPKAPKAPAPAKFRPRDTEWKPGQRVRIARHIATHTNGWNNSWVSPMDRALSKVATIQSVSLNAREVYLEELEFGWPMDALDLIEEEKSTEKPYSWVGRREPKLGDFVKRNEWPSFYEVVAETDHHFTIQDDNQIRWDYKKGLGGWEFRENPPFKPGDSIIIPWRGPTQVVECVKYKDYWPRLHKAANVKSKPGYPNRLEDWVVRYGDYLSEWAFCNNGVVAAE